MFKKLVIASIVLLATLSYSFTSFAEDDDSQPQRGKNGIWIKRYSIKGMDKQFYYVVDSVTKECFALNKMAMGGGITPISCLKLKTRPEWKHVILWD